VLKLSSHVGFLAILVSSVGVVYLKKESVQIQKDFNFHVVYIGGVGLMRAVVLNPEKIL